MSHQPEDIEDPDSVKYELQQKLMRDQNQKTKEWTKREDQFINEI